MKSILQYLKRQTKTDKFYRTRYEWYCELINNDVRFEKVIADKTWNEWIVCNRYLKIQKIKAKINDSIDVRHQ